MSAGLRCRCLVGHGCTGLVVGVPEALGDLGLGWVELSVVLEETGAHLAATPLLQQVVALDVLTRAASAGASARRSGTHAAETAARWLPALVAGEVRAEQSVGGTWTVSGRTQPAIFASHAAIVLVNTPAGVLLVDLADVCGPPDREPAMDFSRALDWLEFVSTPAVRIGDADAATTLLDAGAIAHSCELLGSDARLLDRSVAWDGR